MLYSHIFTQKQTLHCAEIILIEWRAGCQVIYWIYSLISLNLDTNFQQYQEKSIQCVGAFFSCYCFCPFADAQYNIGMCVHYLVALMQFWRTSISLYLVGFSAACLSQLVITCENILQTCRKSSKIPHSTGRHWGQLAHGSWQGKQAVSFKTSWPQMHTRHIFLQLYHRSH